MEKDHTRATRFARNYDPFVLDRFARQRAAWHESPEEVRAGLRVARRNRALLHWVREAMTRCLTPCEQRYVQLYYFEYLTLAEVAKCCGTNVSSACRGVQRGIRKLRAARDADDSWRAL